MSYPFGLSIFAACWTLDGGARVVADDAVYDLERLAHLRLRTVIMIDSTAVPTKHILLRAETEGAFFAMLMLH